MLIREVENTNLSLGKGRKKKKKGVPFGCRPGGGKEGERKTA